MGTFIQCKQQSNLYNKIDPSLGIAQRVEKKCKTMLYIYIS